MLFCDEALFYFIGPERRGEERRDPVFVGKNKCLATDRLYYCPPYETQTDSQQESVLVSQLL